MKWATGATGLRVPAGSQIATPPPGAGPSARDGDSRRAPDGAARNRLKAAVNGHKIGAGSHPHRARTASLG